MKEVESEWKFAQTRILAVDEASMVSIEVIPMFKTRLYGDNINGTTHLHHYLCKRTIVIAIQTF